MLTVQEQSDFSRELSCLFRERSGFFQERPALSTSDPVFSRRDPVFSRTMLTFPGATPSFPGALCSFQEWPYLLPERVCLLQDRSFPAMNDRFAPTDGAFVPGLSRSSQGRSWRLQEESPRS